MRCMQAVSEAYEVLGKGMLTTVNCPRSDTGIITDKALPMHEWTTAIVACECYNILQLTLRIADCVESNH